MQIIDKFSTRNWSISGCCICGGPRNHPLWLQKGSCTHEVALTSYITARIKKWMDAEEDHTWKSIKAARHMFCLNIRIHFLNTRGDALNGVSSPNRAAPSHFYVCSLLAQHKIFFHTIFVICMWKFKKQIHLPPLHILSLATNSQFCLG